MKVIQSEIKYIEKIDIHDEDGKYQKSLIIDLGNFQRIKILLEQEDIDDLITKLED